MTPSTVATATSTSAGTQLIRPVRPVSPGEGVVATAGPRAFEDAACWAAASAEGVGTGGEASRLSRSSRRSDYVPQSSAASMRYQVVIIHQPAA